MSVYDPLWDASDLLSENFKLFSPSSVVADAQQSLYGYSTGNSIPKRDPVNYEIKFGKTGLFSRIAGNHDADTSFHNFDGGIQLLDNVLQSGFGDGLRPATQVLSKGKQLSEVTGLREANKNLREALFQKKVGKLQLQEEHVGIVTRLIDDVVVIRFETQAGVIEQTYDRNTLLTPDVLKEGDRVMACCFLWARRHVPKGLGSILSPEEIQHVIEIDKCRTPSPLEI